MRRAVLAVTLGLLGASCFEAADPGASWPPEGPVVGPVGLGSVRRVGGWDVAVAASTLRPRGWDAHERMLPTGPRVQGEHRFLVTLEADPGPGGSRFWADLDIKAGGRSPRVYRPFRGPACRGRRPSGPDPAGAVRLCFSVAPEDAHFLQLLVAPRDGSGVPVLFYLRSTTH